MSYLQDLLSNLKQEVPCQWRVQSRNKDKTKAICSAYIDSRDVMKVLDMYCDRGWQTDVKELAGFIFYGIGINVPVMAKGAMGEYEMDTTTLWRWDTGSRIEDNKTDNMYEQAGKSAASDAFKRAAVQWGVGRFLYDLPVVSVACDQYSTYDDKGQKIWDLTKHINGLQKFKKPVVLAGPNIGIGNAIIPTELSVRQPAVNTPEPTGKKKLDQVAYDNMVKFINDGKVAQVEKGMKNYDLTDSQKTLLTSLINQERSKALKSSAKKK